MPLPKEVLDTFPEDIRNDPSLADVNDVPTLAKRLVDTKKFVGASVRPPGPDATPEARKEFVEKMLKHDPDLVYAKDEESLWKRLGKPEKAEEYELPPEVKDAGIPEGDIRALALATGLTRGQAKALATAMANAKHAEKKASDDALALLKAEYGAAFDEKASAARQAAVKVGGLTAEEAAALPPKMLKAYANVAKALGATAPPLREQNDGGQGGKLTPSEAKMQLAEIRNNPAYWDKSKNPMLHDQLVAKVQTLTGMAFPE